MSRDEAQVRRRASRVVPFWILQAAELLALVGLADLSLHVANGGVLVAAGVVFAVLALTADGPLGVIRICGRRLHVVLVVVASALTALAPVVPALRPDIEGIIILEVIAVGILRLATLTNTAAAGHPSADSSSGLAIDATAPVVTESPAYVSTPTPTSAVPTTSAAARWAGRAVGAAGAAAVRTSAQHRPAAEAHVKRAIRSAGRATGKALSVTDTDRPDIS